MTDSPRTDWRWLWFLPLLAGVLLAQVTPLGDPDLFWHLKTGEWILAHHRLPAVNTFSHTEPNHPWLVFEWLSQIIFYLFYRAFDVWGIYLLRALLTVGAFALWFRLALRQMKDAAAAALFLFLILVFMRYRFGERPELFSQFFVAVFASWLLLKQPRTPREWAPLWLAQVLWVNLHGYFFVGPLLCGWWVARRFTLQQEAPSVVIQRLLGVLGVLLATCLNPWGPKIFLFLFSVKKSVVLGHVNEFLPAGLLQLDPTVVGMLACALAALGIAALRAVRDHRRHVATLPRHQASSLLLWGLVGVALDAGLLASVLLMGQQHIRFYWLLAVLSIPIALFSLPRHEGKPLLGRRLHLISPVVVLALLTGLGFWRIKPTQWSLGWEKEIYPEHAMQFVEKHNLFGTLYNEYGAGGWFIFHYYPRLKTFMDGRFAFSENFYATFFNPFQHGKGFQPLLKKYSVELIVMTGGLSRAAYYAYFPAGGPYKTVFFDSRDIVAIPRAKAIHLHEYQYFCPCANEEFHYLKRFSQPPLRQMVDRDIMRFVRQSKSEGAAFASHWFRTTNRPHKSLLFLNMIKTQESKKDLYNYESALTALALHQKEKARAFARRALPFLDQEWFELLAQVGMKSQALQNARRTAEEELFTLRAHESARWLSTRAPSRLERAKWRRIARERLLVYTHYRLLQMKEALDRNDLPTALNHAYHAQLSQPESKGLKKVLAILKKRTGAVFPEDLLPPPPTPRKPQSRP